MEKIPITIWGADVFDGTPENPKLKIFLNKALATIMCESLAMLRRPDCVLLLSEGLWEKLKKSQEVLSVLMTSPFSPVHSSFVPETILGFEIRWVKMPGIEELEKQTNDFVYKDA